MNARLFFVLALFAATLFGATLAEENMTEVEINEKITDHGFVEGDIVLPKAIQFELETALKSKSLDRNRLPQALVADHSFYKWPDATVNYVFDSTVENHAQTKNAINAAIADFQNKTCIKFRKRTNEADYVSFAKGQGCWSYIGRVGGPQTISIGRGCESKGVVIHEIFHALGRWHEQSRPDRDQYVTVHPENMIDGVAANFEKVQLSSVVTIQGISYDLGSIMHYRAFSFSKNGQPTLKPKDPNVSIYSLGQRNGFSEKDLQHVRTHYDCAKAPQAEWGSWSSWSSCSRTCNGGTQSRNRTCNGGTNCKGSNYESRDCNTDACPAPPTWSTWSVWSKCSQSCGTGRQSRTRTCVNGTTCSGSTIEYRDCATNNCPDPPSWTSWSSWGDCSTTCRGGVRSRTRRCENGDTCSGNSTQFEECNKNTPCTPDPGSGEWGEWSSCSATCGNGRRTRSRNCGLPDSSDCHTFTEDCKIKDCPNPLPGLKHLGCYFLPTSSQRLLLLENKTPDLRDDPLRRSKPIEKCGLGALQYNYTAFSLMLGFCISGSNITGDYITTRAIFCKDGRGGNFNELLFMDVYEIENRQSYAIAATEVVHSTLISFPKPTVQPPVVFENKSASYKFIPSFVLLFVVTLLALAFHF